MKPIELLTDRPVKRQTPSSPALDKLNLLTRDTPPLYLGALWIEPRVRFDDFGNAYVPQPSRVHP